jgi:Domain of unknown function (DUF4145)
VFWRRSTAKGKRGEPLPERHDGAPDSDRPSGLCPRCEKQSSFKFVGSLPLTFSENLTIEPSGDTSARFYERAAVLLCHHCRQGLVVLEEEWIGDHRSAEGVGGGGTISWRGFHWWPVAGASFHEAIPESILSAFNEAIRALSAECPRAAAVMGRRTLEALAADKGESDGPLSTRLRRLADRGLLHPSLVDWANEVRLVGNSGAHFDPLSDVSLEDARQLVELVRELAKFLYVMPFELNERRQSPSSPPRRA